MAQAGTIAGIAYAAVCGAVAHLGAVVATCTAAKASIAFITGGAAFSGTCVGYGVTADAIMNVQHLVD